MRNHLLIPVLLAVAPAAVAQTRADSLAARTPTRSAPVLTVVTPEARINQMFEWATLDMAGPLARTAAGDFEGARGFLVSRAPHPRPHATTAENTMWLLACVDYWNASADQVFLREMWPHITRVFGRVAVTDADEDGLMDHPLTGVHVAASWIAAVDGIQQMARAMKDNALHARSLRIAAKAQPSFERMYWVPGDSLYAATPLRAAVATVWGADAIALGIADAERSAAMLRRMASTAVTADWGARVVARSDATYDPLRADRGAVTPFATSALALAHYRLHRGWAGLDLVRDVARMSFDFTGGVPPAVLNGEYYQSVEDAPPVPGAAAAFIMPVVRGLIGWHTDAASRAALLEPHLPAGWPSVQVNGLRVGRDRIDATISRERGLYSVHLRRRTTGPALSIRVSPALPMGARLERIVIDDRDAAVQAEESAHDVHGVAELMLVHDAQIEFHYEGGMEVIAPTERLTVGAPSRHVRVLDFQLDARDYVIELEGMASVQYPVHLRTGLTIRTASGADSFEQNAERATLLVTMPAGNGFVRKTIRVRPVSR